MNEERNQENREQEFESSETFYSTASAEFSFDKQSSNSQTEHNGFSEPSQPLPEETPEYHKYELVAMILGILSIVLYSCCCIGIVLGIISIVYAYKVRNMSTDKKMSGMALAGLICSIIGFAVLLLYVVLFVFIFFIIGITSFL
ncbi:MAG: DUF4190 domain-containing protein [Ruminococcaceae bacterium]|nr:DUF4190 domain-containing protein [Oscillospiraceae bacterium]